VRVDEMTFDPPPQVSIERTEAGFLATGIVC
jgi:hypothetical protein